MITFEEKTDSDNNLIVSIIGAKNSIEGVDAEYGYLEKKFGKKGIDWKLERQELIGKIGSNQKFDRLILKLADGSERKIIFDTSDFFGKGLEPKIMDRVSFIEANKYLIQLLKKRDDANYNPLFCKDAVPLFEKILAKLNTTISDEDFKKIIENEYQSVLKTLGSVESGSIRDSGQSIKDIYQVFAKIYISLSNPTIENLILGIMKGLKAYEESIQKYLSNGEEKKVYDKEPIQHCPICDKKVEPRTRYPDYICQDCVSRAVDDKGRRLKFHNQDFSGGFVANILDESGKETSEESKNHICYIDGKRCWAEEAYLGGIVVTLKDNVLKEGIVDKIGEHMEISYGKLDAGPHRAFNPTQEVALVSKVSKTEFLYQFLIEDTEENKPIRDAVLRELDFYLVQHPKRMDPGFGEAWNYAIYHSDTMSNIYSDVHWDFYPSNFEAVKKELRFIIEKTHLALQGTKNAQMPKKVTMTPALLKLTDEATAQHIYNNLLMEAIFESKNMSEKKNK